MNRVYHLLLSLLLGIIFPNILASVVKRSIVCYGSLGCFSNGGVFYRRQRNFVTMTPDSPDIIRTEFQLFTRDNPKAAELLDARDISQTKSSWSGFKNRTTKIVVHGFMEVPRISSWLPEIKDELLKTDDHNVIVVDWSYGNRPPYSLATANARVVGAQIAQLIQHLMNDYQMPPSAFHLIGHSLGAMVCAYAGERIPDLGRITGLDPAGPYFEGSDRIVRLDPTDAQFVDVIHSDTGNFWQRGYGIRQTVGHADFFPNDGHDQPGCEADPLTKLGEYGITHGLGEIVFCSHLRSIKFFIESINTKCPFMAFPCNNDDDFVNKKCLTCPKGGCPSMGYHADRNKPRHKTKYYLTTASTDPFCQYHLDVKIQLADAALATSESGNLKIRVHSDKGMTDFIQLNQYPIDYDIGETLEFLVGLPSDFGDITSVDFSWDHVAPLLNPLKWNLFNTRHPRLYVHQIDVRREEAKSVVHLCAGNAGVETGHTLTLSKAC